MIICSCARISDKDIKSAIDWMRASDPQVVVTPRKLYRALGKSPDCGGCMRLFVASMRAELSIAASDQTETVWSDAKTGNTSASCAFQSIQRAGLIGKRYSDLPIELRNLRPGRTEEEAHEGRTKSYRVSQRGASA